MCVKCKPQRIVKNVCVCATGSGESGVSEADGGRGGGGGCSSADAALLLAAQREHLRVQHERRERQPGVLLTPRARAHWIHVLERWLLAHSSYEHSTPLILRVTYEWLLVLACARAYSSW